MQRDKPFVYEEKEETKRLQLHELPPERFTEQENQFSIGHNKLNGTSRQSDSPLFPTPLGLFYDASSGFRHRDV
jgi:hypothetical protein